MTGKKVAKKAGNAKKVDETHKDGSPSASKEQIKLLCKLAYERGHRSDWKPDYQTLGNLTVAEAGAAINELFEQDQIRPGPATDKQVQFIQDLNAQMGIKAPDDLEEYDFEEASQAIAELKHERQRQKVGSVDVQDVLKRVKA